jgi:hypothetical protein
MHNRQALSWKMVIECLLDCKLTLCLDLLRLSIFQLSENATRVRTRRVHSTPKVLEALRFSSVDIRANLQSSGHMLPIYLIAVSFGMPTNPMSAYLTLQLRDIGFDTFQTNLLTIPAYLLFIAQLLFWTWVSERWNQRFLVGLSSQLWALPLLLFLEYSPADIEHWINIQSRHCLWDIRTSTPFLWPSRVVMPERCERGLWQAHYTICFVRLARLYLRM